MGIAQVHDVRIEYRPTPSPILPDRVVNDLFIDFSGRYGGSQMIVELSSGSIYQDPVGSNIPPLSAILPLFPSVEYDTFVAQGATTVDGPYGAPAVIGGAVDLGEDATVVFDETYISIGWSATTDAITDQSDFLVARVTLSDDATGMLRFTASANNEIGIGGSEFQLPIIQGCFGLCDDDQPFPLAGDFNSNGIVEQGDLDLVLLNWGAAADPPPADWTDSFPSGRIDQDELDEVLLHWGNERVSQLGLATVPEPSALTIVLGILAGVIAFCGRMTTL
jgi:hypothetical protein